MAGFNTQKDIQKMILKYVEGTATAEEIEFVESYYAWLQGREVPELSLKDQESIRRETFRNIADQLDAPTRSRTRVYTFLRVASVAAVLLIATTTTYIFLKKVPRNEKPGGATVNKPLDIGPGSDMAILTLSDGTRITLDDNADVNIQKRPGLVITRTRKVELIYTVSSQPDNGASIRNNTVTTPRGGQYQVILPDGTHVWLNAASVLTYPESFAGKIRSVKLEGEAYFEVTKNKTMPFHVLTGNQDVEVTGTHFNINGYMDDESINTTLLEGGITIHYRGRSQKVIPGQQAVVSDSPSALKVVAVNTEAVVAWKNGLFEFNDASLRQIMTQLERWYDIKVDYNSLPAKHYNGMVPRSANLSSVLKMLEVTGNIKFKIENNRQLKVLADQ